MDTVNTVLVWHHIAQIHRNQSPCKSECTDDLMHFIHHPPNSDAWGWCMSVRRKTSLLLVSVPPFTFRWHQHSPISLSLADRFHHAISVATNNMSQQSIFLSSAPQNSSQNKKFLSTHSVSLHLQAVLHPWRLQSSRMWHCIVGSAVTRILKDHNAFINNVKQFTSTLSGLLHSEDTCTVIFWNTETYTLNSAVSKHRRLESSVSNSLLTAELLHGEVWDLKQDSHTVSIHKLPCHICI
jgi:hypothetical protein